MTIIPVLTHPRHGRKRARNSTTRYKRRRRKPTQAPQATLRPPYTGSIAIAIGSIVTSIALVPGNVFVLVQRLGRPSTTPASFPEIHTLIILVFGPETEEVQMSFFFIVEGFNLLLLA